VSDPYLLRREQWVPRPLEEVFAFFSDARNLEVLTPPWLHFRILTSEITAVSQGTLIRYKLSWRGIPLRWTTKITLWQPPRAFEDFQLSGPYTLWHHTHSFESLNNGTLMTDEVRYRLPFGPLGKLVHWLAVKANVESIFDYRYQQIERLFGR
jgi:ligand-binding SRPBCC domain-containing protein